MHFTVIQITFMFLISYVCLYALIDRLRNLLWCDFCKWIETLSYSELITGGFNIER